MVFSEIASIFVGLLSALLSTVKAHGIGTTEPTHALANLMIICTAGKSGDGGTCSCESAPGWNLSWSAPWCYEGICYADVDDERCVENPEGENKDLGDGTWCWGDRRDTECTTYRKESPSIRHLKDEKDDECRKFDKERCSREYAYECSWLAEKNMCSMSSAYEVENKRDAGYMDSKDYHDCDCNCYDDHRPYKVDTISGNRWYCASERIDTSNENDWVDDEPCCKNGSAEEECFATAGNDYERCKMLTDRPSENLVCTWFSHKKVCAKDRCFAYAGKSVEKCVSAARCAWNREKGFCHMFRSGTDFLSALGIEKENDVADTQAPKLDNNAVLVIGLVVAGVVIFAMACVMMYLCMRLKKGEQSLLRNRSPVSNSYADDPSTDSVDVVAGDNTVVGVQMDAHGDPEKGKLGRL